MQLQLERQQAQAARQQLETARNATRGSGRANAILNANSVPANPNPSVNHNTNASPNPGPAESSTQHNSHSSQFLLSRWELFPLYTDTEKLTLSCYLATRGLPLRIDSIFLMLPPQAERTTVVRGREAGVRGPVGRPEPVRDGTAALHAAA